MRKKWQQPEMRKKNMRRRTGRFWRGSNKSSAVGLNPPDADREKGE
jgi:hypothetical protein